MFRKDSSWMRRAIALFCGIQLFLATTAPVMAQDGQECSVGAVGWEVFSTNTPGGGGELQSQGLTGERTAWTITQVGPTVAGTAVTNLVVTYYHCKACRDKAKKKQEEDKKKREEEKKKKEEEKKKKKGGKPPEGKPVITFDPRTHELKDGKVVPKDPKKADEHSNCPKPDKFECGEHYRWWLENHDHVQAKPDLNGHEHCDKPEKFECGEHYLWWLKNHQHRTEAQPRRDAQPPLPPAEPSKPEDLREGLDRKIKKTSMLDDKSGMQIVMTGTVVAGEEATVSVTDSSGALISGVVLELPNGEKVTTDDSGRARFKVPLGKEALTLIIAGTLIQRTAWAWNSGGGSPTLHQPGQPSFDPPKVIQPGQPATIPTEGTGANSGVYLNGQKLEPLASSPTSAVVDVPAGIASGQNLWVLTQNGVPVDTSAVDAVQIQVDPPKTLVKNQTADFMVTILGTERSVLLKVDNNSPSVVALDKGLAGGIVQSSGGKENLARIRVKAIGAGEIRLPLHLVSTSSVFQTQR